MQSKKTNSIKQFIFRALAVTITLCYILGPAHIQVNSILHSISHNLKAPSYVLQHDGTSYKEYENEKALKSEMTISNLSHEHQLLDFIDGIFNVPLNRDKNQKGESTTLDFKINKHITSRKSNVVFQNNIKRDVPVFWAATVSCETGYLLQLYRPPKV